MSQPNLERLNEKGLWHQSWREVEQSRVWKNLNLKLSNNHQYLMSELVKEPNERSPQLSDDNIRGKLQMINDIYGYIEAKIKEGETALKELAAISNQ